MQLLGLLNLALVVSPHVPFDVFNQYGPPKTQKKACMDRENTFVPKVIMCLPKKSITTLHRDYKLMMIMWLLIVERSMKEEEVSGDIDKRSKLRVIKIFRTKAEIKEIADLVNLSISSEGLW